ncbi:60S ribosomal protein L13-1, partial [Blastocystis sp. ATCC 50177/Nand II]
MKHNNVLPNAHFKKDWDKRVKTWFDQAGQKRRRRLLRKAKAAAIAPRPACGLLRPEAGINPREAETIGIAVDYRRTNKSVEALQANVERLNAYKSKLVVFPKSGKAEEATQFQGVFMPVEKVAPKVEFMAVSEEMKKHN